jgi:uncharacterized lipoprotein YajG
MKKLLFALFATLLVSACSNSENEIDSKPSQFTPTEQRYEILGCEELKREIQEHNKKNPDDQLTADC